MAVLIGFPAGDEISLAYPACSGMNAVCAARRCSWLVARLQTLSIGFFATVSSEVKGQLIQKAKNKKREHAN